MTDGRLVPKVQRGATSPYELFSDECHGVLELLVLLTNIYDDESDALLIDEPEQNLHPQYQAFVLEELKRSKKHAVLATHSPSFLNIKTIDDLRGVICFHANGAVPSTYQGSLHVDREVAELLPRMTEQHRSFFFAQKPVFVEGYFDTVVVSGIQKALGLNCEAAGSSLVPALGKDEAGRYLMLCNALAKQAVFLFDLDALFDRRLRQGAQQAPDLAARVAAAGHGRYDELVGKLQRALSDALTKLSGAETRPAELAGFFAFLGGNAEPDDLDKRRLALLVALAEQRNALRPILGNDVEQLEGLLKAVLAHLAAVDIHVLPGGAIENYCPSYTGQRYKVPDDLKRPTATSQTTWLSEGHAAETIKARYGALARVVESLPAQRRVQIEPLLKREIANVLHHMVVAIRGGRIRDLSEIGALAEHWSRVDNFLTATSLEVSSPTSFQGELRILDKFGLGELAVRFDSKTQTNDPDSLRLEARVDRSLSAN